jgi:hypothetical protein
LYKSSNTKSGLFSDYNNFDGTPHAVNFNNDATNYMYDAMRCAMNFGMDYYLFGVDAKRQTEMAKRIIDFFEKDGYKHARFTWEGNPIGNDGYTQGEKGANAVATYALMNEDGYEDKIKKNLEMAWNEKFMTGQYRYYDGLVHYLAMLHLTGSFKIWKPQPKVEEKPVEANEYLGVKIEKDTTFYAFESCKLYKVNAKPETNAISTKVQLNNNVRVWSTNNAVVIENAPVGSKFAVTDLNGRVLKASKTTSAMQEIRLANRGNFLVIVGDKTYKIVK